MPEIQKAKQLIIHNQDIAIMPCPEFISDSFPSALSLFYSLKKLGKNVNLITENYPEKYNFLIKEKLQPDKADFLISVKQNGARLSGLFYEKTEQGLDIFLKTTAGTINPENITTRNIGQTELLITIGIQSFKTASRFFKTEPKTVINIDNDMENETFGDANVIQTNSLFLSKIVFDLIKSLDNNPFNANACTALLTSIIEQTNGLQSAGISQETYHKVKFLIEQKADLKTIVDHIPDIADKKGLLLMGRAFVNSKINQARDLITVLFKRSDFKLTDSQPADLKFMLRKISSNVFPFPNFVCLWEQTNSPTEILGVFYTTIPANLEKIYPVFCHRKKGSGILFRSDLKDIEKTKDKILKILSSNNINNT